MALALHHFRFRAMGSPCALRLYSNTLAEAQHCAGLACAEVERLEQRYSRYRDTSELSRVNQVALQGGSTTSDTEFSSLLDYAGQCFQQSGGLFDITSGVLREVWDFGSGTIPPQSAIEPVLARVGWGKLQHKQGVITFLQPGMQLDFGGIVKEYAADRLATLCREQGIAHGLVDLGGDMAVMGPHPGGEPWQVAIRHPRKKDETLGIVALADGGLASSGDYERAIMIDGRRYCHILSPITGWPVQGLAAVSVVAPLCVLAGSLASIAMLKEKEGVAFLQQAGVRFVAMDQEGSRYSA